MGNRVKEKLGLIAEEDVSRLYAQLAMMAFRIKEKLALIVEAHVLQTAKV